jgi:hypothetical protein
MRGQQPFGDQTGTPGAEVHCGGFICQCGGDGFIAPWDQQSCRSCPDPFAGDPCFGEGNLDN